MSNATNEPISLTVSFRGKNHSISISPDSTLSELHRRIEELTEVPPSLQKLLYKGKKATASDEATIAEAGLKNGIKIQMLGSTSQELDGMKAVENENQRRERIMRERALKGTVKVRSTGSGPISSLSSSSSPSLQYRFHDIKPLDHLPNPSAALGLLRRLADDPAIQHVMQKHKFTVGLLTELAPHEHPELLGLNQNAGQAIKLRLRTDRYDGFRLYSEVRRVLCHELTHNVWGDHDENFKTLNSQLNREVAEFERSAKEGTHYLSGGPDVYQPSSDLEREAQVYTLGGDSSASTLAVESQEDRRRRILEATMNRLRKEEEEIEHSCGTQRHIWQINNALQMSTMKQSKLDFSATRRKGSSTVVGKPKATTTQPQASSSKESTTRPIVTPIEIKPKSAARPVKDEQDSSEDEIEEFDESPVEVEEIIEVKPATPPTSVGRTTRSSAKKPPTTEKEEEPSKEASSATVKSSSVKTEDVVKKVEPKAQKIEDLPHLNVNDPKYRRALIDARDKMGNLPMINTGKHTKIHEILRVFDNTYEYGPCVGMTRRERWDRAQAMGLNPPKEIDDILKTQEGSTQVDLVQSVFYGQV
ncbi:hypothetical protein CVT26_016217 [Gymnopilus dilepis]|uniref:WLM domain-containing protein n=1 Tax=Gymnopilus dilepis TaxID=231916 RepID=A0A409WAA5_9AGAR|nr:hypothetical protein CVT26_016217 [Gymnopilus dilepis]